MLQDETIVIAHLEIGEDVRDGEHAGGSWSLCYWGLVVSFCRGSSNWNIGGARRWMLGPGTCAEQRRRRDCDMPTLVTMSPTLAGVQSFHQPQAGCRGAVTRAGGWPRDLASVD